MYDLVITNGKLVTPDRIYEADIAVKDGVYAAFLAKGSQARLYSAYFLKITQAL